jgi:hypothetical protein
MINSLVPGITQSDILLKTGIEAAIKDIKANPWLLDFIFNGLNQDLISSNVYGQKEVDAAKYWFLHNDINVQLAWTLNQPKVPCFSILLESSVEAESTIGDINDLTSEQIDAVTPGIAQQPIVAGPFSCGYDQMTGLVTIPSADATYQINTGCLIVDNVNNKAYPILDVVTTTSFIIGLGINPPPNFNTATIVPASFLFTDDIGSCQFTDTFSIGVYALGEQTNLWRLQSLLMFIFLRYKNIYFENRGLRRATLSLGRFEVNDDFNGQILFSRFFNFRCFVKSWWPTTISPPLTGVSVYPLTVISPTPTPPAYLQQVYQQGWGMVGDKFPPLK